MPPARLEDILAAFADELGTPEAGPKRTKSMIARRLPLAPPQAQLTALSDVAVTNGDGSEADFEHTLELNGHEGLYGNPLEIFQVNLGKLCNMTCGHCHVDAGPDRTDAMMSRETIDACFDALDRTSCHTVDLTGGAPEVHPDFRYVVDEAVSRGKHVIDRCNLTILLVKKFRDLPEWLAKRGVEVVASLPHYRQRNTDAQRGDGTFEKSIDALRRLNEAGYGQGDPKRILTLMSNPAGAYLAGDQSAMEGEWKKALARDFDVHFDRLFCLNNMPISRFLEWLVESGNLEAYMARLVNAFNPGTVDGLMCRNTISISWDGRVFDCDFNQMLEIESELRSPHIRDFDTAAFEARRVRTSRHCYGCTAGTGSSCGGATT